MIPSDKRRYMIRRDVNQIVYKGMIIEQCIQL